MCIMLELKNHKHDNLGMNGRIHMKEKKMFHYTFSLLCGQKLQFNGSKSDHEAQKKK